MAERTVDAYIASLDGWKTEAVAKICQIVRDAAPTAKESIKWAQPVYETNGPFCYIRAFKDSVNLGFWRGANLPDPAGLLQGDGDRMRFIRIKSIADIRESEFAHFVRQAVQLNLDLGDPTKGQ